MKFRSVDSIIAWKPGHSIQGIKAVSFEEYSLKSRFGGQEHLPESLLVQSFIGLADWLVVLSSDYAQMILETEIGEIRFDGHLGPGMRVVQEVVLAEDLGEEVIFHGIGTVGDRKILELTTLKAKKVRLEEFLDPADKKTLFSEISKSS